MAATIRNRLTAFCCRVSLPLILWASFIPAHAASDGFGASCNLGQHDGAEVKQSAFDDRSPQRNLLDEDCIAFGFGNYQFPSITLAELDVQLKRVEVQTANGKGGNIAVIYPNVSEPYRSIFTKIIEGIEEKAKVKTRSYPIEANMDPAELNLQLRRNDTKVVIALGRMGVKAASGLDRDIAVVVGGILTVTDADNQNLVGISMLPDPALLFTRLKTLLPDVKRVVVVYNPAHNEATIKLAREAAKAQGLEIIAHEARDLASAARLYDSTFNSADNRHDAVWLPYDPTTVEENTILPLILKNSWDTGVPFFSSTLLHVKKGALFALYPNNVELGRNLANSALVALTGESRKRGIAPLREVHIAVNLRTASHIGLNIGSQQQRTFDFVFPEP
jgi:putative ABC transport system substrate-binding protein